VISIAQCTAIWEAGAAAGPYFVYSPLLGSFSAAQIAHVCALDDARQKSEEQATQQWRQDKLLWSHDEVDEHELLLSHGESHGLGEGLGLDQSRNSPTPMQLLRTRGLHALLWLIIIGMVVAISQWPCQRSKSVLMDAFEVHDRRMSEKIHFIQFVNI
jgi:hypothetical protein